MQSDGYAGVTEYMDNDDANSASTMQDGSGQQLHVIKVYPLDGKLVAESQFWVAVTQVQNEIAKRLFLRDGQKHRLISTASAMRLLSSENKKDLSEILKVSTNKGGATPAVVLNSIEYIRNHQLHNNANQAIGMGYITNQSSSLANIDNVLTAPSADRITIATLVQVAQLKSWGSIKVSGSEFFRKQVWMEAASRGLYVEGYVHTEEDRRALFMRTHQSAQIHIRPEYWPSGTPKKVFLKPDADLKFKSKVIKNQNITNGKSESELDITDLSEQELTYLLMRVHQMDIDKTNMISTNLALQPTSKIDMNAIENEALQLGIEPLSDEAEF